MDDELKAELRRGRFLWAGMFGMQLFLLGWVVSGSLPPQTKPMPPFAPWVSTLVVVVGIVFVFVLLPRKMVEQLRALDVKTTDVVGESGFRDAAPVAKVVADPERTVLQALQELARPIVHGWGAGMMIASLGFY